ncbi:MAG: hypothetical protein Q4P13_10445, partial [Psychrobacter sp.]|nr:hypothetical protein [Psychrobacter sp.]
MNLPTSPSIISRGQKSSSIKDNQTQQMKGKYPVKSQLDMAQLTPEMLALLAEGDDIVLIEDKQGELVREEEPSDTLEGETEADAETDYLVKNYIDDLALGHEVYQVSDLPYLSQESLPTSEGNQAVSSSKPWVFTSLASLGLATGVSALGADSPSPRSRKETNQPENKQAHITIEGEAKVGETLTAKISDDNGVPGNSITYQWFADGKVIAEATDESLMVNSTLVGKKITVQVAYTDNQGFTESPLSLATVTVIDNPTDKNPPK